MLVLNLTEWKITWEMGHRQAKDVHIGPARELSKEKAHVAKADHQSSMPGTHMVEGDLISAKCTSDHICIHTNK